jgi:hypothetical protein
MQMRQIDETKLGRSLGLLPISFLATQSSPRSAGLLARLQRTGLWNIFNPSLAYTPHGIAIAFRAGRQPGDKPFRAYYLPPEDGDERLIDLTEAFSSLGIAVVSDPKLVMLGDEIWVTFNTGHFEKPNRLFAAQIHPALSRPRELVLPGRELIEKNWAFFRRSGVLHALYSVVPPVVLRESGSAEKDHITFERIQSMTTETPAARGALTIGTQLAPLDAEARDFATIVHRKFYWRGKRAYLGLPARLRCEDDSYSVTIGRRYLGHSFRALFGDDIRHNRNLLSCTYFSGLIVADGRTLIGYGINDVAANFADVSAQVLGFEPS